MQRALELIFPKILLTMCDCVLQDYVTQRKKYIVTFEPQLMTVSLKK